MVGGKVTAVAQGVATITAKVDDKTAKATVNVSSLPFPVLTVSQGTVELIVGGSGITVIPTLKYDGVVVVEPVYTWTVKDDTIAKVTNGLIEPLSAGETEVTVSTTHNGEFVEKTIIVTVSIDASVVLSIYNVDLDAVDIDGSQKVSESITMSALVNDVEVIDQAFTIELDEEIVAYTLNGNTLAVTPLLAGSTKLTVSFLYDEVKVFSVVNIVVSKVAFEIDYVFNFDLSKQIEQPLDLTKIGLIGDAVSIKSGDEVISSEDNVNVLTPAFLSSVSTGDVKNINVETQFVIYKTQIKFVNAYKDVEFMSAENGNESTYTKFTGDVTTLGFDANTEVFKFYTGNKAGAWDSRLQTTEALGGYDWWMMDFVLTEPLTGQITLWIGFFHVVVINTDGRASLLEPGENFKGNPAKYDSVNIYNKDGVRQTSGLQPNVVYTLEINLEYRANDPRDSFGVNASTTMYLANIFAASHSYYLENVGEKDDPFVDDTFGVTFKLTADNNVGATFDYVEAASAFDYHTGVNTNVWANRIEAKQFRDKKI